LDNVREVDVREQPNLEDTPMIRKTKSATLLAFSVALLGTICVPSRAEAECTAATIENTYGFHFDGLVGPTTSTALKVASFVPAAGVGEISFTPTSDTGGTISGSESLSFGGLQFQPTFTGAYTVNAPKCTGSLTATFQDGGTPALTFVIVKGGEEIEFLQTNAGVVAQGVMKKE
jgi:hypothetical protein